MSVLNLDDVDVLRARLVEETQSALELADELAALCSSRPFEGQAIARATANYLQTRNLVRRLQRAVTAGVAG